MQSQATAQKRPASAPVGRSASMDAPPSVSVINLNEEMAAEQRASGGVLGARPVTHHSFHAASSTSLRRQLSLADFVNPSRQRATAAQGQGRPSSAGPVVGGRRARGIHITARFFLKRMPLSHLFLLSVFPPGRRRRAGERQSNRRRPVSGRERDMLHTGTSGVGALEKRLIRG